MYTKTPPHQLIPHALSHIANTPEASRTSVGKALGKTSGNVVAGLVDHLITQGVLTEGELMSSTGGRPARRLSVTGEKPTIPFISGKRRKQ